MPAGRPHGALNKNTRDIKALAHKHGPKAIERLAHLMLHAEGEQAQVAACREILDRAYGKATQPIAGDDSMAAIRTMLMVGFVGPRSDG